MRTQQATSTAHYFEHLGLGRAKHRSTERSAVTSAWGVDWSEELIARDLMQNFFDANRSQLDRIVVAAQDACVRVSAPAGFDLHHLYFLGSEKGDDDVGKYGEGFKAATVCILRRKNTAVLAASGNDGLIIRLSEEAAVGTNLYPLVYEFFDLEQAVPGSVLVIDGAWRELRGAMAQGLTHFYYDGNPVIGAKLLGHGQDFRVFRSTTAGGHIFYRNLRRGDIPDLPVVLVLNKQYQRIEKEVAKDRDRKAFGEPLRETFYNIWAQHFFRGWAAQEPIVASAKRLWQQGRGHPLLAAIGRVSAHGQWPAVRSAAMFGNGFYAESHTSDASQLLRFSDQEAAWQREGRIKLPSYFETFGVVSARRREKELHEAARLEARKKGAHVPTRAEAAAIGVLRHVLSELAPKIVQFFEESRTSYTVAATEVLLGEFKRSRDYRSREVFLAEQVFEGDFAEALAVFLHEHAHIHGYDGSRSFTDALTETLESIVRQRKTLDGFEKEWDEARKAVAAERTKTSHAAVDALEQLRGYDRDELLALVEGLPRNVLRSALRQRRRRQS